MAPESLNNAKLMMTFAAIENRGLDVQIAGLTSAHVIFEIKPLASEDLPPSLRMQIQQSRGYLFCAKLTRVTPVSKDADDADLMLGPWLWVEGMERSRRNLDTREFAWARAYWPEPAADLFSLVLQHYLLATSDDPESVIPTVQFIDGTAVEA